MDLSGHRPWIARTSQEGKYDRFELHLTDKIHVLSLEGAEKIARDILGLLDIELAQPESSLTEAREEIRELRERRTIQEELISSNYDYIAKLHKERKDSINIETCPTKPT